MRALPYLQSPLSVGNGEGLPTTDPRFADIARASEAGRHSEAADAADRILAEGLIDIRLMKYGAFAAFMEDGIQRLPDILDGLQAVLHTSLERIGPAHKRGLHVRKSVSWLLDQLERTLAYHHARRDAAWRKLASGPERVEAALEGLARLVEALPVEDRPAVEEPRSRLGRTLREIHERSRAETAPEPLEPPEPDGPAPRSPPEAHPQEGATVHIQASPPLTLLLEKLRAFESLTRRGDFRKAALVAADVQGVIDHFDPREYFPDLFATFGGLLSEHVDSIAPYWDQRESVSWRMLEQFYRVDLSAFVGEDGGKD